MKNNLSILSIFAVAKKRDYPISSWPTNLSRRKYLSIYIYRTIGAENKYEHSKWFLTRDLAPAKRRRNVDLRLREFNRPPFPIRFAI